MTFFKWLFTPRHTAESVARELLDGLEDGSIVPDEPPTEPPPAPVDDEPTTPDAARPQP